jgi:hypothetical protein
MGGRAGQTLEIHSEDFYKELTTSLKQKVVMHMQRDFTSKVCRTPIHTQFAPSKAIGVSPLRS